MKEAIIQRSPLPPPSLHVPHYASMYTLRNVTSQEPREDLLASSECGSFELNQAQTI